MVKKKQGPHFKDADIRTLKFVDDELNMNKINMRRSALLVEDGHFFKIVRDRQTEGLLKHIAKRAEERGMVINEKKTGLLCISAATSFSTKAQVVLNNQQVTGTESLRILGLTIDSDCTFKSHVNALKSKLRSKTWALSKLKKKGLDLDKIVRAYKCLIRPCVEYLAPVWGAMITAEQAALLECQQTQALKNIFGAKISAKKLRDLADVDLLSVRRKQLSLSFAKKSLRNERSKHWFRERPCPRYARRNSTNYPRYSEALVRTDRHRNSPLNYLTRLLNE